jgi:hypothetical protein
MIATKKYRISRRFCRGTRFDGLGDLTSQATSGLVQAGINSSGQAVYVNTSNTVTYNHAIIGADAGYPG